MLDFQTHLAGQPSATETAILAASLTSSFFFTLLIRKKPSLARTVTKTISTALLSALVFVDGGPNLLVGALALGSLGDFFLAWREDDTTFLYGLASFLIAHVLYIVLFFRTGIGKAAYAQEQWRIALLGGLAVLAPGLNVLMMPRLPSGLKGPVMLYSAVIACMVVVALTMEDRRIVRGALLFTASDMILATERFLLDEGSSAVVRGLMQYSVWGLYYSGQLLIALGFCV
jgi:uncharacterized membrane protein YhhN